MAFDLRNQKISSLAYFIAILGVVLFVITWLGLIIQLGSLRLLLMPFQEFWIIVMR